MSRDELTKTSVVNTSPSSSSQAVENGSPFSVQSHCYRKDNARPRKRERKKDEFLRGGHIRGSLKSIIKRKFEFSKDKVILRIVRK